MRAMLKHNSLDSSDIFTHRGTDSSRLEQLSDGVIALAITLLLVSLETPKTGDELIVFAKDFLAFALSTVVLIAIWFVHYLYFLRFGLRDRKVLLINSWLLIVVLFFVYPLKFIISFLLSYVKYIFLIIFNFEYDRQAFIQLVTEVSSWEKLPFIMLIYSTGYVALMLSFALFYQHAYRKRKELKLSVAEEQKTYMIMSKYYLQCGVAGLSVLIAFIALFMPIPWFALLAGFVYFLMGPLSWLMQRRQKKNAAQMV